MAETWKLTAHAPKSRVEKALLAHDEIEEWNPELVIAGRELSPGKPLQWVLEAWLPRRPLKADREAVLGLFKGRKPSLKAETLPDTDWVSESQKGVEPIRAGRFHVRTPEHDADTFPGITDFLIPASQAFGTGQHTTTAACLRLLDEMKRRGLAPRNIADIGTGTGLLAFAALDLWPGALMTASDIDPVCAEVVEENAALNGVRMGAGHGAVTMVIAGGVDNLLLQTRAPYDLLIANILAGPLIELASDFAGTVSAGGSVLLAGLLDTQETEVRRACFRAGFRLAARLQVNEWPVLWLRRRAAR